MKNIVFIEILEDESLYAKHLKVCKLCPPSGLEPNRYKKCKIGTKILQEYKIETRLWRFSKL